MEIQEPASFAFLAGHSTVAEYHEQRREQRRARRSRALTDDAKWEISTILLMTEERLIGKQGPFRVIASILRAYFNEWGWGTV